MLTLIFKLYWQDTALFAKQLPIATCYDIEVFFRLGTAYSHELAGELWKETLHYWPMQVVITSSQDNRTNPSDIRGFAFWRCLQLILIPR